MNIKFWSAGFLLIPKVYAVIASPFTYYGGDFTHGFDTQNYPKLQASLGTQPKNTHGIQRQTQPDPYPWIFSGRVIPTYTRLKFLPLGTMGTRLKFLPSGTQGPWKLATIVFILNPKLYYSRSIVIVIWAMKLCLHFCSLTNNSKK